MRVCRLFTGNDSETLLEESSEDKSDDLKKEETLAIGGPTDVKLNETEVESELSKSKRHDQEEISISVDLSSPAKTELKLEEDHGQADEDDKDLYPNNRR